MAEICRSSVTQRTAPNSASPFRERLNKGLVVVIDHQPNYRDTLNEKFRLLGFRSVACANPASGLAAIKAEAHVAGVLVDIIPGHRESLKFIQKLRHQLGPTGLIFTTSNFPSARDLRADLKAAGATECFEKPIHADNFAYIVKLLDSNDLTAALVKVAA
jgi:DNA-binding NtrC family response regulator